MKTAKDLRIPFTWEDRRPVLLDRFFYIPKSYDKHDSWGKFNWNDPQIFGNDNPVYIEYCSGNGQWIGERAKQTKEINWVAVEKRFDRARKIWLKLHRESIPNLYVVCGDALSFTRYYCGASSVSEIFVNFPDPWPKLRHAKHRLVRAEFLEEVKRIVHVGGKGTFVTDDPPYAKLMLEEIRRVAAWKPLLPEPHFTTEWGDYGRSFFANLWKEKGRTIHYILYEREA